MVYTLFAKKKIRSNVEEKRDAREKICSTSSSTCKYIHVLFFEKI